VYTRLRHYQSLKEVDINEEFYLSPPQGTLAQTILDHSCEEDASAASASAAAVAVHPPHIDNKPAFNLLQKPQNDENGLQLNGDGDGDVDDKNDNDMNEWLSHKLFGGYALYCYIIVGLIAYSSALTAIAVMACIRSKRRNGGHFELKPATDYDDETDACGDEENML